jgi:hypothetical protein
VEGAVVYIVSSSATLSGLSAAELGASGATVVTEQIAVMLGVHATSINVTSVADAASRRRRELRAAAAPSVTVAFEVLSASSPWALLDAVTALSADASAFAALLRAASLSTITGVSVALPALSVRGGAALAPPPTLIALTDASAEAQWAASVADAIASSTTFAAAAALALRAGVALNDGASLNSSAVDARGAVLLALSGAALEAVSASDLRLLAAATAALAADVAQLSTLGANAVLTILDAVSAAGAATNSSLLSNATVDAVAASLSSVIKAARAPDSSLDGAVLQRCFDVVNNVADALTSSPTSTFIVSSDMLNMSVQIDAATPGSTLFSTPLRAPGANASFAPLPPSLFANVSPELTERGVRTLILSLAYDPYEHDVEASGVGITRLAFYAVGGAPIHISGLSVPLTFTLPALANLTAGGVKTQCRFWDESAGVYATDGCVAIPSPAPRGHNLSWSPGFEAHSDADMVLAWHIEGSLMDGCDEVLLNCSDAVASANMTLFPNPGDPFGTPGVRCNATGAGAAPMRVFMGVGCALIRGDNNVGCAWSNARQAFVGDACVAPAGGVQCACRHLTDFNGARAPNIPMCSATELQSLPPGDIVSKLQTLLIIVLSLFACLHAGAAFGLVLDRRQRARVMTRLCTPECGFVALDGSFGGGNDNICWLWRFALDPLPDDLHAPTGTAVALSAVFGIPVARLRAALPDECFGVAGVGTGLGAALGRRHGFSRAGMDGARVQHTKLLSAKSRGALQPWGTFSGDASASRAARLRKAASVLAVDDDGFTTPAPVLDTTSVEHFTGTALVLAFLQVTQLASVARLDALSRSAAMHFGGIASSAGWDFEDTRCKFLTLLSPGVLSCRTNWWMSACLWRLVLAQSPDGGWRCSSSIAFALHARAPTEEVELQPSCLGRLKDKIIMAVEAGKYFISADITEGDAGRDEREGGAASATGMDGAAVAPAGDLRPAGSGAPTGGESSAPPMSHPVSFRRNALGNNSRTERLYGALHPCDGAPLDDPLACSAHSVLQALPQRLVDLAASGDGGVNGALVEEVWTTLCAVAALERMQSSWLWGSGEEYGAEECTVVDAGRAWVARQAAAHAPLGAALADGGVARAACWVTARWRAAWMAAIEDLRRTDAIVNDRLLTQAERACTNVWRAMVTKHSTAAVFLSEPLDGLQRWQSACASRR